MPLSPKCDVDLKFKASKYPGPDAQILTRNVSYQYYLVTPDTTFWLWKDEGKSICPHPNPS